MENIILQISEAQHGCQERIIINALVDDKVATTIVNYEDLSVEEKVTYNAFKSLCQSKI